MATHVTGWIETQNIIKMITDVHRIVTSLLPICHIRWSGSAPLLSSLPPLLVSLLVLRDGLLLSMTPGLLLVKVVQTLCLKEPVYLGSCDTS